MTSVRVLTWMVIGVLLFGLFIIAASAWSIPYLEVQKPNILNTQILPVQGQESPVFGAIKPILMDAVSKDSVYAPKDTLRIRSIEPSTGNVGTTVPFVILGEGFVQGAQASLVKGANLSIQAENETVISKNALSGIFIIPADAELNYWIVVVVQDGKEAKGSVRFKTVNGTVPALVSIQPDTGMQGSNVPFILKGNNFIDGISVQLVQNGNESINATGITIKSSTLLNGTFSIPANATPGIRKVTANIGTMYAKRTLNFKIISSSVIPHVTSIRPNSGYPGTKIPFVIFGKNFAQSAVVYLTLNGSVNITAEDVVVPFSSTIRGNFTIPSTIKPGNWWVKVEQGGVTNRNDCLFKVLQIPAPMINKIIPDAGVEGTDVAFRLGGDHFKPGANLSIDLVRNGYPIISARNVSATSKNLVYGTFSLPMNTTGRWRVTATQDGQLSKKTTLFTVVA